MEAPPPPAPDIFSTDGLSRIAGYVARQFASTKSAAVLMITTLDEQGTMTLLAMGGKTQFSLAVNWESSSPQETNARQCFVRLGVVAEEKENDGQRILGFPLEGDAKSVTNATVSILKQIYNVGEHDGLRFRFDEWQF